MSKIDVKLIQKVRSTTGAALQTCKRALEEAKGNVEAAIEGIKKMGQAIAAKKADRATSAGGIVGQVYQTTEGHYRAGLLECQSETDFVSSNEAFVSFSKQVLETALKAGVKTVEQLSTLQLDDEQTVEQARQALIAKVGENIQISRYQFFETHEQVGLYVHQGRYGCVVIMKGEKPEVAKDIAVHVVVSHPNDHAELMQQEFYKDPSSTVEKYLHQHHSAVIEYSYFILGNSFA